VSPSLLLLQLGWEDEFLKTFFTTEVNYVAVRRLVFDPALRLGETATSLRSRKTGGAPSFHQQIPLLPVDQQSNADIFSFKFYYQT